MEARTDQLPTSTRTAVVVVDTTRESCKAHTYPTARRQGAFAWGMAIFDPLVSGALQGWAFGTARHASVRTGACIRMVSVAV